MVWEHVCKEITVLLKEALISPLWCRNNFQMVDVSSEMKEGHYILYKNKCGSFLGGNGQGD